MKVTVLGTSAAYPGPGQACSGFLIQQANTNLLVDCGTGVLSNLQKFLELWKVSDIVISHMHADHFIDLIPYRYALRFGPENGHGVRPRLHVPRGGTETLKQVVAPFSESEGFFDEVFETSEYDPRAQITAGNLNLAFALVNHYVPSFAISIMGTHKVAYTSDTGPCPAVLEVAQNADILIANVGRCLDPDRDSLWGHLRPSDAGKLARDAGAKRLLLSHFWPGCKQPAGLDQAVREFGRTTELAEECRTYDLG